MGSAPDKNAPVDQSCRMLELETIIETGALVVANVVRANATLTAERVGDWIKGSKSG